MNSLGNPLGQGVDPGEGRGRDRRKEIEFNGGGSRGEEEKPERGPDAKKGGLGIFRSEKAKKNSKDEDQGEGTRADFKPEAGRIGMAGYKFAEQVEGDGGEGEESLHGAYNSIGGSGCQPCRKIQRVEGMRCVGISAG